MKITIMPSGLLSIIELKVILHVEKYRWSQPERKLLFFPQLKNWIMGYRI